MASKTVKAGPVAGTDLRNTDLAINSEHSHPASRAQYRPEEETAISAAMRRALERREVSQ